MKNIDLNNFIGKNINLILDKADELFNENVEGKIHAHKIYSELLEQVPNIYKKANESGFRGSLRKKIWDCEKFFFWNEKYPSQAGQDKIIKKLFFNNKKEGFFVEIGAYDGITGSNCFHFERFQNWKGIALEPSEIQFEKLKKNRICKLINKAVSSEVKEVEFIEVTDGLTQMSGINNIFFKRNSDIISNNKVSKTKVLKIQTTTFDQIVPRNIDIDYLSIDIEGGEMDLLNSINFNNYNIKVISVENNVSGEQNFKIFFDKKDFIYFDRVGQDEIFYNSKYFKFD
jgi:FkbM family methyltransferase|tara:strand:- start:642 stop:1499 length:858 start_codon:yes stop_codon:yes gene_type:complete